jgi:hypothetical protein
LSATTVFVVVCMAARTMPPAPRPSVPSSTMF